MNKQDQLIIISDLFNGFILMTISLRAHYGCALTNAAKEYTLILVTLSSAYTLFYVRIIQDSMSTPMNLQLSFAKSM